MELLARIILILRAFEFRKTFQENYTRTCSLFQGVLAVIFPRSVVFAGVHCAFTVAVIRMIGMKVYEVMILALTSEKYHMRYGWI